jgi:hypothetical protein
MRSTFSSYVYSSVRRTMHHLLSLPVAYSTFQILKFKHIQFPFHLQHILLKFLNLCTSLTSHACHIPRPSHVSLFHQSNDVCTETNYEAQWNLLTGFHKSSCNSHFKYIRRVSKLLRMLHIFCRNFFFFSANAHVNFLTCHSL